MSDPLRAGSSSAGFSGEIAEDASSRAARHAVLADAQLAWGRKKRRTGPPAAPFAPGLAVSPASDAAGHPTTAPLPATDFLSQLTDGPLDTIVNHFPPGAFEPARMAVAGRMLRMALTERARSDRLVDLACSADAVGLTELIQQSRALPIPMQAAVFGSVAVRIGRLAAVSQCVVAPLSTLRLAIRNLQNTVHGEAALGTLFEQFRTTDFRRIPVTPALDAFFKACHGDIAQFASRDSRNRLTNLWAGGLRMLRAPDERLSTWQALFDADRSDPACALRLDALAFALKDLEPVAARLVAIDAVFEEAETLTPSRQTYLTASMLQALDQPSVVQQSRDRRYFWIIGLARKMPIRERQVALAHLATSIHLVASSRRFGLLERMLAAVPAAGDALGAGLVCAIVRSIPYLLDGMQREAIWVGCGSRLYQMPADDTRELLQALTDTIPCMPDAEQQWHRFQELMCHVFCLDRGRQAELLPHLQTLIHQRHFGPHFWRAVPKVMLVVQTLPALQRETPLCNMLALLRPNDPAVELLSTLNWVRSNAARLSPAGRAAVADAMAKALHVFVDQGLLGAACKVVEAEAGHLEAATRARICADVDRILMTEADGLHGAIVLMEPDQFLPRFGALVTAACKAGTASTDPVIQAVMALLGTARAIAYGNAGTMLQICRSEFPPELQYLLDLSEPHAA